ncbi:MAG: hypothetical protein ACE5HP_12655 [Gemmatimonadota bacterium]
MARCIKNCLATYFSNLGWFAIAAIVLCLIGGGILGGPPGIIACLAAAGVGAVAVGAVACIAFCA